MTRTPFIAMGATHQRLGVALATLLLVGLPVFAETPSLAEARACAEQESRLERLLCYDALFLDGSPDPARVSTPRSSLWQLAAELESTRGADRRGLLVHETAGRVVMTTPALDLAPPRPVLVIACDASITRFQLHLPTPVSVARVPLRLQNATGETRLEQTWLKREQGHLLSGGQGLPAIDTLRRLLNVEHLNLSSELVTIDGLRFDLSGLPTAIRPLRDLCRW